MTLYFYLAIGAALVALGGYGTWKWRDGEVARLEAEAANAAQGAQVWEAVANDYKGDLDESQRIAKQRAVELAASKDREGKFRAALDSVGKADKPSGDWLATPVPDAVRRVRRVEAGCPASTDLQCAPGQPPADPGATAGRRDGEGPPPGGKPTAGGPGTGQRG